LTSDDFKEFFMKHFEGNEKAKAVDWDAWFYNKGMPAELPELDQSLALDSQNLANIWFSVDRDSKPPPTQNDMSTWSSLQITCFLDALQIKTGDKKPLKISTLKAMDGLYHFAESRNSEVLYRYCELAIPAEDSSILPVVVRFITTQGRMKFTRPLYRALYKSKMGKDLAVTTFLKHKDFYHPICSKMVALDLKVGKATSNAMSPLMLAGLAAAAAAVGFALLRRRK
jgi:leukotriene-A4 hydrolase